ENEKTEHDAEPVYSKSRMQEIKNDSYRDGHSDAIAKIILIIIVLVGLIGVSLLIFMPPNTANLGQPDQIEYPIIMFNPEIGVVPDEEKFSEERKILEIPTLKY